jgi:hypothetical protein
MAATEFDADVTVSNALRWRCADFDRWLCVGQVDLILGVPPLER